MLVSDWLLLTEACCWYLLEWLMLLSNDLACVMDRHVVLMFSIACK